jgi:hypothetical protein
VYAASDYRRFFAVAPWRVYQVFGRRTGVVVSEPAAKVEEMPLKWVPGNLPNLPFVDGVVRLTKEYDPERQIAVPLVRPDTSQGACRACWHPTPPEAYEEWRSHLVQGELLTVPRARPLLPPQPAGHLQLHSLARRPQDAPLTQQFVYPALLQS